MTSELNENIRQGLETQLGQGLAARFTGWCFGPGNLGLHAGFLAALAPMICFSFMADFNWDLKLLSRLGIVAIAGYFGGGIGGVTARDESLREAWAQHRILVGLVTGSMIGALGGALFLDGWITLAGAIGGGIGGFADTIVHRKILESDW